jgi:hypothetical protein
MDRDVVLDSFSKSNTAMSTCICCGAEEETRTKTGEGQRFPPGQADVEVEMEMHICRVCGYIWQRVEQENGLVQETHDLQPSYKPGQMSRRDIPQSTMMRQGIASGPWQACFRARAVPSGVEKEPIPQDEFNSEVERRRRIRRAITCN